MITVRYHRRRFVDEYTGARVSIDCRIQVPRINHRFLRVNRQARLDRSVLEVKGAHRDLPSTLRIITDLGCRKSSWSKYATCHQHLQSIRN